MLLLFQCLTGDGWSAFMSDLMIDEARGCDPDALPHSDCGSALALPYFIGFTVIGTFVFINLVVAVILENFTALGNVNPELVSAHDIADFREAWALYDPDAEGYIDVHDLPRLVSRLPPPLGVRGSPEGATYGRICRFCVELGLTTRHGGRLAFRDVLDALIQANYKRNEVEVVAEVDAADGSDGRAGADVPPAVRAVLEVKRRQSLDAGLAADAFADAKRKQDQRHEMAMLFADQLFSRFVRARREKQRRRGLEQSHQAATLV